MRNLKLFGNYVLELKDSIEIAELLNLCIQYDIRIIEAQHFTQPFRKYRFWFIRNNCIEAISNYKMVKRAKFNGFTFFNTLDELKRYLKNE